LFRRVFFPPGGLRWSGEAALDLQWAHAIAPQAKLVVVEAVSSRKDDMFVAVDKASDLAESSGGGVVSLSWSYDEFGGNASTHVPGESAYDRHFQHDKILYFASSGDQGGWAEYRRHHPLWCLSAEPRFCGMRVMQS
jgi:kumamolisin